MTRDIADIRRDYEGGRLEEDQVPDDPLALFDECWHWHWRPKATTATS